MDKQDFDKHYCLFCTAVLYGQRPISRYDTAMIHRAQSEKVGLTGGWVWKLPDNPNAIDLIELRGSIMLVNGQPQGVLEDTQGIFINHFYDSEMELLQDFSDGDLVTVLYQKNHSRKMKGGAHPEFIYNHETNVMARCFSDFTVYNYDIVQQNGIRIFFGNHKTNLHAAHSIQFLKKQRLIPQQGNQPRLVNNEPRPYFRYWKANWGFVHSCLTWLIVSAIAIGLMVWYFNR